MSQSYRVTSIAPAQASLSRIVLGMLAVGIAALSQGCSASRGPEYGTNSSRLWGYDRSAYDADGPGPAQPYAGYRGSRDPIVASRQDWPPAAPPDAYGQAPASPYRSPYAPATPAPYPAGDG